MDVWRKKVSNCNCHRRKIHVRFFLCITIFYGVKTYFIALVSDKGKRKRNGEEFSFCIQRTNKMIYDYGGIYEKKGDFLKC